MKLIIRIFILLAVVVAGGCSKNEFTIDFELPEDVTLNISAAYHATDKGGGMHIEAVAPVTHGKGNLKCVTRYPVLVYLRIGSSKQTTVIYAERGNKITASGKNTRMETWTFSGNQINERWSEWRNTYADTIAAGDPKTINIAVAKYVYANPSAPLSTLLLLTSFSRKDDEKLFRSLWFKLEGEAREKKWVELVSRADQPTMYLSNPGKLISAAFRSAGNGIDTLRTDSAKASFFFFWNAGLSKRKEYIDSIKALAKAYPDSASRIIADVCMEPDSMAWRSPLRSDSLKKVTRLWVPAGMADRRLMDLEVRQSPFFIVFSPDGRQQYRGDDISEAIKEFRILMK